MQTLMHFVAITGIMLLYYFLPVIIFYYILYVRNKAKWLPLKIQKKQPGNEQMRRELKMSLIAIAFFSVAVFLNSQAQSTAKDSIAQIENERMELSRMQERIRAKQDSLVRQRIKIEEEQRKVEAQRKIEETNKIVQYLFE